MGSLDPNSTLFDLLMVGKLRMPQNILQQRWPAVGGGQVEQS